MKIIKEFKEFAIKGNMFDMAIGIIIGTAFNKLVSSFVADILSPLLALFLGKVELSNLLLTLRAAKLNDKGEVVKEAITLNYGAFLQLSLDFLIVSLTVFVVIKLFNSLRNKADDETNQEVPTPKNIQLLSEIRDALVNQAKK